MAGYKPLKITGNQTGLVQEREEFLLPNDAYPTLQNAYVWREKIKRKLGYQFLGRLQRTLINFNPGSTSAGGTLTVNLISSAPIEPTGQIIPGTTIVTVGGTITYTDNGSGILVSSGIGSGTINYANGLITITGTTPSASVRIFFSYYPGLPVMGIRIRELQNSANDQTIFFDQNYAYIFNGSTGLFQLFIPGTTWNASGLGVDGTNFFWSTNYWVSDLTNFTSAGFKLFWVTNDSGLNATPDPIRITDGITWLNFQPPTYGQIDATNFLVNCLCFLPFRGRMVTFNTFEGTNLAGAINYTNRIRWSTIGNPFIPFAAGPPATGSWRSDIRGQGGFLDIPTSEDIVSVGFVRDNLVIYCERSTWQLRYTGRSIAPFQIERVNSELGVEGTFSSVQFDTSLIGIGDKGVVECDSYKSQRIDIKIPDLVFKFSAQNNGVARVHGIRDFPNRLAYWTFPLESAYDPEIPTDSQIFCNERLVYNYENDSWAIFNDSLTALGTFQTTFGQNWLSIHRPWIDLDFPWIDQATEAPQIVGGNQQGFIEVLDRLTTNDVSLYISNIVGNATSISPPAGTATIITSPNHNMSTGFVIGISGIIAGSPYATLNNGVFGIIVIDQNTFSLTLYNASTDQFDLPQLDIPTGTYIGGGLINIRENFTIQSKKFNFLDEGQNIQLGFLDILMSSTTAEQGGAIALNVYLDYNDSEASNTLPQNDVNDDLAVGTPDTFFNSIIPTTSSDYNNVGGTKFWQRVFCATRASFLTLEYTFSNAQMAGKEQELDVQIDAQILWIRKSGRMTQG